jgi:hypothetical protein
VARRNKRANYHERHQRVGRSARARARGARRVIETAPRGARARRRERPATRELSSHVTAAVLSRECTSDCDSPHTCVLPCVVSACVPRGSRTLSSHGGAPAAARRTPRARESRLTAPRRARRGRAPRRYVYTQYTGYGPCAMRDLKIKVGAEMRNPWRNRSLAKAF